MARAPAASVCPGLRSPGSSGAEPCLQRGRVGVGVGVNVNVNVNVIVIVNEGPSATPLHRRAPWGLEKRNSEVSDAAPHQ